MKRVSIDHNVVNKLVCLTLFEQSVNERKTFLWHFLLFFCFFFLFFFLHILSHRNSISLSPILNEIPNTQASVLHSPIGNKNKKNFFLTRPNCITNERFKCNEVAYRTMMMLSLPGSMITIFIREWVRERERRLNTITSGLLSMFSLSRFSSCQHQTNDLWMFYN